MENKYSLNLNALIVFVKNPVLGKVKTRLAATTSAEDALRVYSALVSHTQRILEGLPAHIRVYYSDQLEVNQGWPDKHCTVYVQQGNTLGERLHHAFRETFDQGYRRVVVIGSDCLELTSDHLVSSFDLLTDHDVVMGPTFDGGYYLMGMTDFHPTLFAQKAWSTPLVYSQTLQDIEALNLTWQALETLHDIDTYEDVLGTPLQVLLHTSSA